MSMNDKTTVADILCEFLEVAVHNILYTRKLYPSSIFVPKKKYGVVLYQSVHPEVNEYIVQCMKAINFHAKKSQLKRMFLCLHNGTETLDKYVFEVLNLANKFDSDEFLVDLEQNLRAFMLKLHASQNYLNNLPGEATFSIRIQTSAYSSLEFNHEPVFEDFPWIEVTDKETFGRSCDIVPLHTVESDFLHLQLFVETPYVD